VIAEDVLRHTYGAAVGLFVHINRQNLFYHRVVKMVSEVGFELTTSPTQTERPTRLAYTEINFGRARWNTYYQHWRAVKGPVS
jgi:hypothetical protein